MSLRSPDLNTMLAELADGTISAADFARLETALREDRAARDELRAWMAMEAALPWVLGSETGATTAGGVSATACRLPGPVHRDRFAGVRRLAGMWLVPAIIVAGGLAAAMFWHGGAREEAGLVAIAEATADAVWHDAVVRKLGDMLPSGVVRLERGAAQVRFARGAVVSLNAPVEFEVLGDNRLFLRSGRITSSVPAEAHGFTVVSPTGEVVDFGTEFTVGVDRDGKTDVYVVAGEVDVAGGHSVLEERVRLTQGFATRLGGAGIGSPGITQQPIVLDSFDRAGPVSAGAPLRLRWSSVDRDEPAEIKDGGFRIPIDGRPGRLYPIARVAVEQDFSVLVGRRSHISFKAALPDVGTAPIVRWAGIVIDDRRHAAEMAYKEEACFGVLVSPSWQAQVLVKGKEITRQRVFARDSEATGPYQVVMVLDDSAAGRKRSGGTSLTVLINGIEIVRDHPVDLCSVPRMQFQTNTLQNVGGQGFAVIDDVCVSVEVAVEPEKS